MTIGLIWLIWLIGLIGLIGTYCGARGGRLQDWEHGGDARRWSRHTRRAKPARRGEGTSGFRPHTAPRGRRGADGSARAAVPVAKMGKFFGFWGGCREVFYNMFLGKYLVGRVLRF